MCTLPCDNTRRGLRGLRAPVLSDWTAPVGNIGVGGDCLTAATTARSLSPLHCAPFRAWVSCPTSCTGTIPQTAGDHRPRQPYRG